MENPNKRHRRIWPLLCLLLVLALALFGTWLYIKNKDKGPLPKSVEQSVSFPIYYPSPVPAGYIYKKGSASFQKGILFYTLSSGSQDSLVSEQAIPQNPPDLNSLTGFKKFQTIAGDAVIGTNLGKPVVIILSNTTLISITGSQNTPKDALTRLAASMSSLPQ